VITEVYW